MKTSSRKQATTYLLPSVAELLSQPVSPASSPSPTKQEQPEGEQATRTATLLLTPSGHLPTLGRLVELTATLAHPVDPEEVKRILFPAEVVVQFRLREREEILKKNQAWRNGHKAFVGATRSYLSDWRHQLREKTVQALERELSPCGFPEDAEPVYGMSHGTVRKYKSGIEFDKASLGVDTDKRNLLVGRLITLLADYLFPRLNVAAGLPGKSDIYTYIGDLLREAYPPSILTFPNGRKEQVVALKDWNNRSGWRAIRKLDHNRDQRE